MREVQRVRIMRSGESTAPADKRGLDDTPDTGDCNREHVFNGALGAGAEPGSRLETEGKKTDGDRFEQ